MTAKVEIAAMTDAGSIGVCHPKRLWSSSMAIRAGDASARDDEWHQEELLLDGLGLGLHQTMRFLFDHSPSFPEFEEWVVQTTGTPDTELIDRLNADICGRPYAPGTRQWLDAVESSKAVLTVVPGFHLQLESWLDSLDGRDSQQEDLHALGPVPVAGSAGDLVIWNQFLPHGSRPNLGTLPRIVQYTNMYLGRDGASD